MTPDGEAEELVDLAHPLGIALGQVVIDCDHMNAVAGECVEVAGEGGDEGLAFASSHFGDLALVQHCGADQLHVEVAHLHGAPAGLADHRKGFGKQLFQGIFFSGGHPSSGSVIPSSLEAIRARNSTVLSRNCSSVSCLISGSKAPIWPTTASIV